jgi:hypothetical protein
MNFPFCICGGWAVYYTINDIFKKQKNRDYLGSQDIDIGFSLQSMMGKGDLESTTLFKTLNILESHGYKPEGFRYRKDIPFATIDSEDDYGENKTFVLYVDILVNSYPPSLYDLYPNCFFEEPLLDQVYNNTQYQVKIPSISDHLFIPTREILIAMKIRSLPARGIRHKIIKDLCDLYGLLWFSPKPVTKIIDEVSEFLDRNSLKQLKNKIDLDLIKDAKRYLESPTVLCIQFLIICIINPTLLDNLDGPGRRQRR